MSRPSTKAIIEIAGSNMHFSQSGTYTIDYLPLGQVKVKVDGRHATVITAGEYAAITSFSFAPGANMAGPVLVNGVIFREAGPGATPGSAVSFETMSHNLDALVGEMISTHGIAWTVDNLIINGSEADTLKLLWDYLDDAYVAGNNYYNLALNETFVRLGAEYVEYLENGGSPLIDVTAKYQADANANGVPDRDQSMHDNLLGNLFSGSIDDRNYGEPLETELRGLIPDEYESRPWYGGYDYQRGGAAHDAVRAFDYDKGWERPDYLDVSYNANIDPLARNGTKMYYGTGNPIDDWTIVRHEGAQVELGLKIKHRGGDEYPEFSIGPDGTATYKVLTGTQIGVPNRAEWNFDFAATDYSPDQDFTYVLEFDMDPGPGVDWATLYSSAVPLDTKTGTGATFQNSSNVAFYRSPNALLGLDGIDIDPSPGFSPYAFGDGTFNVRLSAYDAISGMLVAQNEVVVIVGDGNPYG